MARKVNRAALRAIREAVGISQKTLAARAGLSPAALSQVESGVHGLHIEKVRRLADALGVPLDAISTGEPEPDVVAS